MDPVSVSTPLPLCDHDKVGGSNAPDPESDPDPEVETGPEPDGVSVDPVCDGDGVQLSSVRLIEMISSSFCVPVY